MTEHTTLGGKRFDPKDRGPKEVQITDVRA